MRYTIKATNKKGNSVNRSTVLEEVQVMLREIISYLIKNKP